MEVVMNKKSPARKLLLMASWLILCSIFAAMGVFAADEPGVNEPGVDKPTVRVEPTNTVGPRTLEKQTETAVSTTKSRSSITARCSARNRSAPVTWPC
jgi:hypothetical protein